MKKIVKTNEFFVAITVVALCLFIGIRNPVFFTGANAVSLLKNSVVDGIMAFALMLGIIAGGIDVSFPAIAVCSFYLTNKLMQTIDFQGSVVLPILMAVAIGTVLGFINGVIIAKYNLPAFIVTLGTSSVFHGLLISLVGSRQIGRLQPPLEEMSKASLFTVQSDNAVSSMPVTFIFLVVIAIVVHIILKYTMLGRGIYAVGGDRVSAERAGFPVKGIQVFVYTFIGMAAGLAGIVHSIQARMAIPTDLMGNEMLIIAAVVLGGTNISGGSGTVIGTALGLALITITKNSLILIGIPSTAQRFVLGLIIVAGTAVSAYQALRNSRKNPKILADTDTPVKNVEGGAANV